MYEIHLRVGEDTAAALKSLAERRKEAMAVVARRILSEAVAQEAAADGLNAIIPAVRKAMRDVLKPTEDRLAKLAVKAAIAAGTSMYLNTQALADLGKHDAGDMYQKSRAKALAFIRAPDDGEN